MPCDRTLVVVLSVQLEGPWVLFAMKLYMIKEMRPANYT